MRRWHCGNRLLHFRFCHLFEAKPDPNALLAGVEPRINQIALPLLSLVDDEALRSEIADRLRQEQAEHRTSTATGDNRKRVYSLLLERGVCGHRRRAPVSVGTIAARFNAAHEAEYGQPVSDKWVGHIVRKTLRLSTRKSNGVYIVPLSEKPKIDALAARYT